MRRFIVALLGTGALLLAPATASALTWKPVTGPTGSILDQVGTVRGPDGTLHVVWARQTPGSGGITDDVLQARVSAGGIVGSPVVIASAYASISNPAIVSLPGGGLEVFFGGIQCLSPTCSSGLYGATSSDGGKTWSTPMAFYDRNANYGSSISAVALPDGTPFETWFGTAGVFVHRGSDPSTPDYDYQSAMGAGCCGYYSNLAADGSGNVEATWDSNATNFLGVWARPVDPATGAPAGSPMRMPGTVTTYAGAPNTVQMLSRTPIVALPGRVGQFYVAYSGGYPTATRVLLWRVGSASSTTIVNESGDHNQVSVAADSADRLWVFWTHSVAGGSHVYASRVGPAGIEPAIDLGMPAHAQSIYALDGAASPGGDPEALALAQLASGTDATYYVRGPQVAPPRNGASVDLVKVSGTVKFKLPGRGPFFTLLDREQVPVGATVDATHGKVRIEAAKPSGGIETADLADGEFVVSQRRHQSLVSLKLTGGSFGGCAHHPHHVVRSLSASGGGEFATDGRDADATAAHSATWVTEDECAGTLVKVAHGKLSVRDLIHGLTVAVHAGHSYLARAIKHRHR
jgi:hypothetical protein